MTASAVAELGRVLSDESRVRILDALFDGRAYTVTEISNHVGVSRSTTSEHLSRLLDADLVAMSAQGRHRYYALRDERVARMLESLEQFGAGLPVPRATRVPTALAYARSCYDHLAGTVGVGLTSRLFELEAVKYHEASPRLTDVGRDLFAQAGVELDIAGPKRRPLRDCLDWTERRQHLAGAVPARVLDHMLEQRWFIRKHADRALTLTDRGRAALLDHFGYAAP